MKVFILRFSTSNKNNARALLDEKEEKREIKSPSPSFLIVGLFVCVFVLEVSCGEMSESNKSPERRLNLSRSWHKGHSHAYNT